MMITLNVLFLYTIVAMESVLTVSKSDKAIEIELNFLFENLRIRYYFSMKNTFFYCPIS